MSAERQQRSRSDRAGARPWRRQARTGAGVVRSRGPRNYVATVDATSEPSVVIVTALQVESYAVRRALTSTSVVPVGGLLLERGTLVAESRTWIVYLVETGPGNIDAAVTTVLVVSRLRPHYALFVGVAGGIKDVSIGDVVFASKVYYYEGGKDADKFYSRPASAPPSSDLLSVARVLCAVPELSAVVAPIAAGEKLVGSAKSNTAEHVRKNFSDAVAVEMEGYGFVRGCTAVAVPWAVVRGISDLLDGKPEADSSGSQERAAEAATDFAIRLLGKCAELHPKPVSVEPVPEVLVETAALDPLNLEAEHSENSSLFIRAVEPLGHIGPPEFSAALVNEVRRFNVQFDSIEMRRQAEEHNHQSVVFQTAICVPSSDLGGDT
jgi:5'-methylthioadenosine/S-adenosylhomocysteine nucleosidase